MKLEDTTVQKLSKSVDAHKFQHGHAIVLSGGAGQSGAARLAARGALRIGAGVVTVACPPTSLQENSAHLDAVMCTMFEGTDELHDLLKDTRINALCAGPGLGLTRARALVPILLATQRAAVFDADALTVLANFPGMFGRLHDKCVLTPHFGEFMRLFPDLADKIGQVTQVGDVYSKKDATQEAATRAGCVVVFKGRDTAIASPDGAARVHSAGKERAAPWLATAGSGDVLAGFIAGLLARGFDVREAAETGVWLHVACALQFGPGLIAEDLAEMLPVVFERLNV